MVQDQNGQTDAARTKLQFYANQTALNAAFEELTNAYEKTIQELLLKIQDLEKLNKDKDKKDKK
jgi:hypothetical protein